MFTILARVAASVRKHAEYRRTLGALRAVPLALAEDLNVFPGMEKRIAHHAVYGA